MNPYCASMVILLRYTGTVFRGTKQEGPPSLVFFLPPSFQDSNIPLWWDPKQNKGAVSEKTRKSLILKRDIYFAKKAVYLSLKICILL